MAEPGEQFVKACQSFIACNAGRKPTEPATIQDISSLVHLMQCMFTSFAPALAAAAKLQAVEEELQNTKSELNLLRGKIVDLAKNCNDQLRFSYDYNLLIHGVEEKDNETEDALRKSALSVLAGVATKPKSADIELIHRLGKMVPGKSRPILCRFINRAIKRRVVREFFAKTKLEKAGAASPDEANNIRSPVTNHSPFKKLINVDELVGTDHPHSSKTVYTNRESTKVARRKHHRQRQ